MTANQTHTPGPWRLREIASGWELSAESGGWLFELYDRPDRDGETDEFFIAAQEANARLIAAAPELLAALQATLAALHGDTPESTRQAITDAEAAIAKAEASANA